jgi:hypothetical protein
MAREPGQEDKGTGQDAPLYKAWLSNGQEHLSRVFGRRLAGVVVAFAFALLVMLAVSFVYGLIWYLNPIFSANNELSTTDRKDLVQGFASVAQAAAVGLAGAVGLVGLFFTWRSLRQARESQAQTQENTRRTLELTEQGQITERFTQAIDQLGATDDEGNKLFEIRLGGIYALERIARESEEDHWPIMEVLIAYVRQHAPWQPEEGQQGEEDATIEKPEEDSGGSRGESEPPEHRPGYLPGYMSPAYHYYGFPAPAADIQAIMTVIRRRTRSYPIGEPEPLDLHQTNLEGANLLGANLLGADLRRANLLGANLLGANLWGASLLGANLEGADLSGANLRPVDLSGMNLRRADLSGMNLLGANLSAADLSAADLSAAYHVIQAQLDETNGDENTRLPPDLKPPAHWGVKTDEQIEGD